MNKVTATAATKIAAGTATKIDAARVVADHLGWVVAPGGYIKRADGTTVAQGWNATAARVANRGLIAKTARGGFQIDWRKVAKNA